MSPYKETNLGDDNHTYTQKIDVLDLLINIIKEHEEKLDEMVTRLEIVAPQLVNLGERGGDTQSIDSALLDMKAYLDYSNSYKLEPS